MSKNRLRDHSRTIFILILLLIIIGALLLTIYFPKFAAQSSNSIVVGAGTIVAMIATAYLTIPFIATNQGLAGLLIGLGIALFIGVIVWPKIKKQQAKPAVTTLQKEASPSTQKIPITTPVKAVEVKAVEPKAEAVPVDTSPEETTT